MSIQKEWLIIHSWSNSWGLQIPSCGDSMGRCKWGFFYEILAIKFPNTKLISELKKEELVNKKKKQVLGTKARSRRTQLLQNNSWVPVAPPKSERSAPHSSTKLMQALAFLSLPATATLQLGHPEDSCITRFPFTHSKATAVTSANTAVLCWHKTRSNHSDCPKLEMSELHGWKRWQERRGRGRGAGRGRGRRGGGRGSGEETGKEREEDEERSVAMTMRKQYFASVCDRNGNSKNVAA